MGKQSLTNVLSVASVSAMLRQPQVQEAVSQELFWDVLASAWYVYNTIYPVLTRATTTQLRCMRLTDKLARLYR